MENSVKKTLGKIQLIEEPKSEDLLRKELEETLGGWNCGSFYQGEGGSIACAGYSSSGCKDGKSADYCERYNTK